MTIELTEKMKHRAIGTVVLIILMVTITPSFFHKSHLKIEQQLDVAVAIPAPPPKPKITIAPEPKLEHIKPEAVVLEPLVKKPEIIVEKTIKNLKTLSIPKTETQQIKILSVTPNVLKKAYQVQLGAFSDKRNALNLVNNLKQQGYKATIVVLVKKTSHAPSYRVLVGSEQEINNAKSLQKKLADLVKINGFVVYEEVV